MNEIEAMSILENNIEFANNLPKWQQNENEIEMMEFCKKALVKQIPIPIEEWCEEDGDCLWWKFPIEESPYCGSPLDYEWKNNKYDGYYTHFTRLVIPMLT